MYLCPNTNWMLVVNMLNHFCIFIIFKLAKFRCFPIKCDPLPNPALFYREKLTTFQGEKASRKAALNFLLE